LSYFLHARNGSTAYRARRGGAANPLAVNAPKPGGSKFFQSGWDASAVIIGDRSSVAERNAETPDLRSGIVTARAKRAKQQSLWKKFEGLTESRV
jgi:hypothetical protein